MPSFGGLTVSLQSQYDALTIPESHLPSTPLIDNSTTSPNLSSSHNALTTLSRLINVGVPAYPSSQFWICYTCPKPLPPLPNNAPAHQKQPAIRFYYFKLYVAGTCVLSWGVGEQERWSGKTMFGLFDAGTDFKGRKVVEKRGLFFPKSEKGGQNEKGFEVRVFRAMGRKREGVKYEKFFAALGIAGNGICMTANGRVKDERHRMYTYALLDPKDKPFVTFRYTFRNSEHLRETNLGGESQAASSSTGKEQTNVFMDSPGSSSRSASDHATPSPKSGNSKLKTYPRRLSIPPRKPLKPTTPQTPHPSPTKPEPVASVARGGKAPAEEEEKLDNAPQGHEVRTREPEFETPSPVNNNLIKYGLISGTPPSQRRAASAGLLRSVVTSATRRKEKREK